MPALELSGEWRGVPVIDAAAARQRFRDVLDLAAGYGGRIVINRNGRPIAALVSIGELGDLLDRDEAADAAMIAAEPRPANAVRKYDIALHEASSEPVAASGAEPAHASLLQGLEAEIAAIVRDRVESCIAEVARQASELTLGEVINAERDEKGRPIDEVTTVEHVVELVRSSAVEESRAGDSVDSESGAAFRSQEREIREVAVQE